MVVHGNELLHEPAPLLSLTLNLAVASILQGATVGGMWYLRQGKQVLCTAQ